MQKHSSIPNSIHKSSILENLNLKKDSSKTNMSKVLNKIHNRKKTSKQQYNPCKFMICSEKLNS